MIGKSHMQVLPIQAVYSLQGASHLDLFKNSQNLQLPNKYKCLSTKYALSINFSPLILTPINISNFPILYLYICNSIYVKCPCPDIVIYPNS